MADPTTVPGLVQRWRASTVAQGNGTAVASWAALAGGAALTQATAANRPTYITAGIGGQPSVRFVTANAQSLTASPPAQAQPCTIIVVHRLARIDATIQELFVSGGQQIITLSAGYDTFAGTDLTGGTMTTASRVLTYVANGASSQMILDGTVAVSGASGANAAGSATVVGDQAGGGRALDGDIAEIFVYSHALTATERATVHSYVQDTYGIVVADYVSSAVTVSVVAPLNERDLLTVTALSGVQAGNPYAATYTATYGGVTNPASAPTANAGPNQTVKATYTPAGVTGPIITLTGAASTAANVTVSSYAWTQVSGVAVTLSGAGATRTFTPPRYGGTFVFGLVVTDSNGATSPQSTVQVTVTSVAYGYVRVAGAWVKRPRFVRRAGAWV